MSSTTGALSRPGPTSIAPFTTTAPSEAAAGGWRTWRGGATLVAATAATVACVAAGLNNNGANGDSNLVFASAMAEDVEYVDSGEVATKMSAVLPLLRAAVGDENVSLDKSE